MVETSATNHDGDPRSPARLGVFGDGGACRVKPVVQGEWIARLGNVDAGVRPRGTDLGTDLVCSDIKAAKHLARICRHQDRAHSRSIKGVRQRKRGSALPYRGRTADRQDRQGRHAIGRNQPPGSRE